VPSCIVAAVINKIVISVMHDRPPDSP
jgi:hypothetical protein